MAHAKPDSENDWLRSIVTTYEGPLVRYAARITGDVDRARDVVQDTFLRLCRQDRRELDGRLAEWLYTVCRRRALDVERKERRMHTPRQRRRRIPGGVHRTGEEGAGNRWAVTIDCPTDGPRGF